MTASGVSHDKVFGWESVESVKSDFADDQLRPPGFRSRRGKGLGGGGKGDGNSFYSCYDRVLNKGKGRNYRHLQLRCPTYPVMKRKRAAFMSVSAAVLRLFDVTISFRFSVSVCACVCVCVGVRVLV